MLEIRVAFSGISNPASTAGATLKWKKPPGGDCEAGANVLSHCLLKSASEKENKKNYYTNKAELRKITFGTYRSILNGVFNSVLQIIVRRLRMIISNR